MKKLLLAAALYLSAFGAYAQTGVFPANTVWGNATAGNAQPKATPWSSFAGTLPLTQYHFLIGNASNIATDTALGGDCTYTTAYGIVCTKSNNVAFGAMAFLGSTAGGDLTGTWPTVSVAAGAITSGKLAAGAAASNVGSLGGDLTGTLPSPSIANNAVTNAKAAQAGANTMKGNWSGVTANVADNAMPSCADTNGNHLNYVSGTGITCGTTSAGSGLVLLNTLTASSSASLSDTTSITGTYSSYLIIFDNLIPATNNVNANFVVHSGGAFQAAGYNEAFTGINDSGAAQAQTGSSVSTTIFNSTANPVSNAYGISGTLRLYNPTATTFPKMWTGNFGYATPHAIFMSGSLIWVGGNGAVDGFQFSFSSGNITSGTIRIYGQI